MLQPLSHDKKLTVHEVESAYQQAQQEFDRVKRNYSGLFSRFKKTISKEDNDSLASLLGVLLPLSTQPVVQRGKSKTVTLDAVTELMQSSLVYAAQFRNSGVEIIGHGQLPF